MKITHVRPDPGDPDAHRATVKHLEVTELDRIDLWWDDGPVLLGWTADNRAVGYRLTPHENAALVSRLAGYLRAYIRTEQEA